MSGPRVCNDVLCSPNLEERMFGASQFMFTGRRSRLRSPDNAGAPFRPARQRGYDLARRYCPFGCPISRQIPGPVHLGSPPDHPGAVFFKLFDYRIRSREKRDDPNFAGRVANRLGRRHCVGDSYSHFILIGAASRATRSGRIGPRAISSCPFVRPACRTLAASPPARADRQTCHWLFELDALPLAHP